VYKPQEKEQFPARPPTLCTLASDSMQFILLDDKKPDFWNGFVNGHPHGHLYQSYPWGEVLSYDGSEVIRAGVQNDGRLCASILLIKKRLPFSKLSFFYAPAGPIIDFADEGALSCLLKGVRGLARTHGAIFLRVDPDYPDDARDVRNSLLRQGFKHLDKNWSSHNYPRILMRLALHESEDKLLGGMRKKHRQHINITDSKGIRLIVGETEDHLRQFWELLRALGTRKGFLVRSYKYFDQLMKNFIACGNGRMLLAEYKQEIIGGVLSVILGRRCWFVYGASNGRSHHIYPNERLHWEMIKWAKSRGCISYDMGGTGTDYPVPSDSEHHPLYHFKKGFGASVVYLTGYYDLVFRPSPYWIFRFGEEYALPLGLRAALGFQRLWKNLSSKVTKKRV
jgi:peptidoglycan pentaglycine glycine transferase (the first glycine)